MRFKTADDIRRHALARGAEAVIDGKSFNAAGNVALLPPPAPKVVAAEPAPTPPPPAPEPGLSREEVQAIVSAQSAETQRAFFAAMQEQQTAMLAAIAQMATKNPSRLIARHEVSVKYNAVGGITTMTITPVYKE